MLVLRFIDPDGQVGFTEAKDPSEAVRFAKTYKAHGYRLDGHFFIKDATR